MITEYLNERDNCKFSALIDAFNACANVDDAFKLGLLVFVYGYLLG